MRKIYDIFPYYAESMIADIRRRSVPADVTVVIEGNQTFSGIPKGFDYPYSSDVRHVKVTDWPKTTSPWQIEEYQENSALKVILKDLKDDDLVIASDCDEIPNFKTILMLKDTLNFSMPAVRLRMTHHKFFFNRYQKEMDWPHAGVCTGAMFKQRNFTGIRRWHLSPVVPDGGWHFYGMGDDQELKRKFQSTSHFCEPSAQEIISKLENGWSLIDAEKDGLHDYDILKLPPAVKLYPAFLA